MNLEKFWIFSEKQLARLHAQRNQAYDEILVECPDFDDRILEKRDLRNMIKIIRNWNSTDHPMLREKVIETAVNLFKRYYLVQSFINANPLQTILCAIYLSLKIQEIDDRGLKNYAERLLKKNLEPRACHYGQDGYTEHEMSFLSAINFEIKALSAIRPLESLLYRLKQNIPEKTRQLRVEKQSIDMLELSYFDDLFFEIHPSKTALCVVLIVLEKNTMGLECVDRGGDIQSILEKYPEEISYIVRRIKQLKRFDHKDATISSKVTLFRSIMKGEEFKKPCLKRNSLSITNIPPDPPKP